MHTLRLTTIILLGSFMAGCGTVPGSKSSKDADAQVPPEQQIASAEQLAGEPAPLSEPTPEVGHAPALESASAPKKRFPKKRVWAKPMMKAVAPVEPRPEVPQASERGVAEALGVVDQAMIRFAVAHVNFTSPSSMELHETDKATLVLNKPEELDALVSDLTSDTRVRNANIQVSNRLQATLRGEGVAVNAGSPASQAHSSVSKWIWDLKAQTEGAGKLHLSMNYQVLIDGEASQRALPPLDREITVAPIQQSGSDFLRNVWLWMFVVVLIVAIAGIWKVKGSTKKA